MYQALRPKLDSAIQFADKANENGLGNPHTLVGAMVTVMRNVAKGQDSGVDAIEKLLRIKEAV